MRFCFLTSDLKTSDFRLQTFMKKVEGIYCQRCLTVNPLGRELCVRCNTRLMLVVETAAVRHLAPGAVVPPVD